MVIQSPPLTVEQFDELVLQPAYSDRRYEFVAGEMVEVVSNYYASAVAARILFLLTYQLIQNDIKGIVTGADGGFQIGNERYIPDIAFVSAKRQPRASREAYNAQVPDLAIEVISNTRNNKELDTLRKKTPNYIAQGVVVWIVNPEAKAVEVYEPGREMVMFRMGDTLTGGDVLPGVQLVIREIFDIDVQDDESTPNPS